MDRQPAADNGFLHSTRIAATKGDHQHTVHRDHRITCNSIRVEPHDTHQLYLKYSHSSSPKLVRPLWGALPSPSYCHLTYGGLSFLTHKLRRSQEGEGPHQSLQVSSTCWPTGLHSTPSPPPGPGIKPAPSTHACKGGSYRKLFPTRAASFTVTSGRSRGSHSRPAEGWEDISAAHSPSQGKHSRTFQALQPDAGSRYLPNHT